MAIAYNPSTGWSNLLSFDIGSDPYSDSSYDSAAGTWFQRSWWSHSRWARKYVNINDIPVKITSMNFLACAGHSNSKRFGGSSSGDLVGPTNGYGCTFTVDIYVVGGESGNESLTSVSSHTLESINQYNCAYGGLGNVSTSNDQTSFGSVAYFGPGTGRDKDTQGHRRYRYKQEFIFDDAPSIPPGHSMFVHVRPTSWPSGSTSTNSMLVIQSADPFFEATMEPAANPYIWRFDGSKWVKDLYAFKFDGKAWSQLKED